MSSLAAQPSPLRKISQLSVMAMTMIACSVQASPQSVHVAGLVTTFGASVANAQGTAVDASGNVYIANADGVIYKESFAPATGTYTQTTILTTATLSSAGIAVDSSGTSIYISTGTGKTVQWFQGSGTTYTLQQTFSGFTGVALPVMYNGVGIYIADEASGVIYKETYTASHFVQTTIATGFSTPTSLAVDLSGDVFISDLAGSTPRLSELKFSGSTYTKSTLTIAGLSNVHGIAVDSAGDLYLQSASTVIEAALSAGVYTTSEFYPYDGESMALDPAGNLYLGSTYLTSETKLTIAPSFGSVAVGTPAPQIAVTFSFASNTSLGNPTVVTQGSIGLDFSLGTGSTCTGAVQSTGSTCVVYVAFTPQTVGQRLGAVNLFSSTGTLIATALTGGIGTAPLVLFPANPNTGVTFSTLLSSPRGLSLDSAGNLYLANQGNGSILKFSITTGNSTTLSTVCAIPGATTVDGAGNLYFSCANNSTMYELVGGVGTAVAVATGVSFDDNLSVDEAGNLFASDSATGAIVEILARTGSVVTLIAGGAGRRFVGMALDAKGNLFAPDYSHNTLYEVAAGTSTLTLLASGSPLNHPHAIAVDAAGNLYVGNSSGSYMYRYAAANYAATPRAIGALGQTGIVIDTSGTMYPVFSNYVLQYPRNSNPPLVFPSTAVGATSASQTVTLENDGNSALTISPSTSGNNPSLSTGFTRGSLSSCPQLLSSSAPASLAPGAACTDVVSFAPVQAGSVSGQMITTDDTLNMAGSSQSFAVSGTATPGTPTVTVASAAAPVFSTATLTAVVSGAGVAPSGAVSFHVGSNPAMQALCVSGSGEETCTVTYPTTGLTPGANTISVAFTADANYAAASGAGTLTLTAVTPVITWPSPSTIVYPAPLSSTQLDATASVPGAFVYTPAAGTVLGAGNNHVLAVTFTPTDNVNYATATAAVSLTIARATPILTWPNPAAIVYGTAFSSAQLAATASVPGSFAYTPAAGTVLQAGIAQILSVTFTPTDTANYTPATATSNLTVLGTAANFGSVPVGTAAPLTPITFNFGSPVLLGPSSVATQGSAGLDFTLGTGSTCSGAQAAGSTCVVYVAFTPLAVGQRLGAVNLVGADGTPIATTLISGTGTGPQVLFQAGMAGTVYSTSLHSPRGLSLDSSGTLYMANQGVGSLVEVSLATGVSTTVNTGCSTLGATAMDGAGDLYVSCNSNRALYELAKGATTPVLIASGIAFDDNLSVDAAGNLYASDENSGAIYKITAGTNTITTLIAGNAGRRFVGMALDGHGNLFAPDFNNNVLYELVAGASSLTVLASGSPLANPHTIAVDSAGNLYLSNYQGAYVYRYSVANYAASPVILRIPGQTGLAIDTAGTIYTIVNDSTLQAFPRNATAPLVFPNTAVGATSSAQAVTIENDGNANLNLPPGSTDTNPSVSAGFAVGPSSTCPQLQTTSTPAILAPGATCTNVISFAPIQTGVISGTLITSDDNLNTIGASQSLVLSGTATRRIPIVTVTNVTAPAFSTATLTAVVSGSGAAPTGAVSFNVASGAVLTATCTAGAHAETCSVSYPITGMAIGPNIIAVNYIADNNYVASNGTGILTVTMATPIVSWQAPSPYAYPAPLSSAQLNATASVPGTFVYTPAAGTVLSVGNNQTLSVTFTPADNVNYATATATVSVNVIQGTPTISWPPPAPIAYGTALSSTQLNATSAVAGSFLYTPSAGTTLGIGPQTLSVQFQPNDPNYTSASQTTNLIVTGSPGFPVTPVGSTSPSVNVLIALSADATISSISVPISQGGKQEYVVGDISGCIADGASINIAGTVCTVAITFTPAYPGTRSVPLQLQTSAGPISISLSGLATGPQVALTPGIVSTIAGNGNDCGGAIADCGGSGLPSDTTLSQPVSLATDSAGNVYFADTGDNRVLMFTAATGIISTIAGNGTPCAHSTDNCGDNGLAIDAHLNSSSGIAVDGAGNLYISDRGDERVREVAAATGIITTVAGTGVPCSTPACGDGGLATNATLIEPGQIALDAAGDLYIADIFDYKVRKVAALTGIISTVAGNGAGCVTPGCGDGGPAVDANLLATGVAVDSSGNLYVSDYYDFRIRKVAFSTGIISTVAGNGQVCPGGTSSCGDGGPGTDASISYAEQLAVDSAGNVYVSDSGDYRIRKISASTGIITTVAGNGEGCNSTDACGDGGLASSANLVWPKGIALDNLGNLYISDTYNHRIRKVDISTSSMTFATTAVGSTSADSPQAATLSNIGNSDLSVIVPASGNNPSLPNGYRLATETTCPQLGTASSAATISPGSDCILSVKFAPIAAGPSSAPLTFSDNALNNIAASQQILLSGNGITTAPILTWANPADIVYGTALSSTQLNAAASVPGTFVYTPGPGSILTVGDHTLSVTFTPTDTATYSTATATTTLTVDQAIPVITWAYPADITYGTALSATQLNATTSIPGTFVYTPILGAILGAGNQSLTVIFTPTDSANYTTATAARTLKVNQAIPVLTWANPADITYGTALSATQLNATASIPGTFVYTPILGAILGAGNQSLTVIFTPTDSANYTTATAARTLKVNQAMPVLTWANPAAISYGTTLSSTQLDATASTAGTFTYSPAAGTLPLAGPQTLSVTFSPTNMADFQPATATVVLNVSEATTTTTLIGSPTAVMYGANILLTATIADGETVVTAGVVTFTSNGVSIGSGPVLNGVAALTISTLPVGADSITASYSGTSNFAASTSSALTITVSADATTISLSASPLHSLYGANVALTATAHAGSASLTSGSISFLSNGKLVGSAPIVNGLAALDLTSLPLGTNSLTATYTGSTDLAASTSPPVTLTVTADTTTILSASPANVTYGASVTLTANVANGSNTTASGTVVFSSNGTPIGSGLIANGIATLTISSLPIGANLITASFGGTAGFASSISNTVTVTIVQKTTSTLLTVSLTDVEYGASVSLTAQVTSSGVPLFNGLVVFLSNGSPVGSATLNDGAARLTLTTLPAGTNSITASFGGTPDFGSSTSASVIITVNPPPPLVTITVTTPLPVKAGALASATATVHASASYAGTLTLTCILMTPPIGAESLPTCNLNPVTLTVTPSGNASSLLAIQTTAATPTPPKRTSNLALWGFRGGSALALLIFTLPSRRKRQRWMASSLLILVSIAMLGCGGDLAISTIPPVRIPPTTAGVYRFTVTATDTVNPSVTSSAVVSVTVE